MICTKQLTGRVLHEVDALDGVVVGDAATLDETLLGGLENHLPNAAVSDVDDTAEDEECREASGLGTGRLGPETTDRLGESAHELLEREQVGQERRKGRESELQGPVVGKGAEKLHDGGGVRSEQQ